MTSPKRLRVIWETVADERSEDLILQALEMLLLPQRTFSGASDLDESPRKADKEGNAP